jgi:hypothetical protein
MSTCEGLVKVSNTLLTPNGLSLLVLDCIERSCLDKCNNRNGHFVYHNHCKSSSPGFLIPANHHPVFLLYALLRLSHPRTFWFNSPTDLGVSPFPLPRSTRSLLGRHITIRPLAQNGGSSEVRLPRPLKPHSLTPHRFFLDTFSSLPAFTDPSALNSTEAFETLENSLNSTIQDIFTEYPPVDIEIFSQVSEALVEIKEGFPAGNTTALNNWQDAIQNLLSTVVHSIFTTYGFEPGEDDKSNKAPTPQQELEADNDTINLVVCIPSSTSLLPSLGTI